MTQTIMHSQEPEKFESLLSGHFAGELDRHAGQAAGRFAQTMSRAAVAAPAAEPAARHRANHARLWLAPALVAAVLAIVVGPRFLPVPARPRVSMNAPPSDGSAAARPTDIAPLGAIDPRGGAAQLASYEVDGGAVEWKAFDEGQVWLDPETPAQRLRLQQSQTVEWIDPHDSARIQITVPREEIVLVSATKY